MTAALFTIRDGRPEDLPFVLDSWMRTYADSAFARSMRHTVFASGHRRAIAAILARPSCRLVVAVAPYAQDVILGWAVVELPDTLHYVRVKASLQRKGIARALVAPVASAAMRFSHKTIDFERWYRSHPTWSHEPYLTFVPRNA